MREVIGNTAAFHWQAENLLTRNLMIWSAAIYCTQVVQDIVVVE